MANIFDTPTKQTYVDTYLPLPFQAIAAIGEKIDKKNTDTEASISALESEISKLDVVGQVNVTPTKTASTGYKEFKDGLLKNIKTKHDDLSGQLARGDIDSNQFSRKAKDMQREFVEDYEKLKFASNNSALIREQNKINRANSDVALDPSVLNSNYIANQAVVSNPWSEYTNTAARKVVNPERAAAEFASNNKDAILRYVNENKGGYHTQGYVTGVSAERLKEQVHSFFNKHEIGIQYRERLNRDLLDGKYGNDDDGNPITFDTPTVITKKDKNGKVISEEASTFGKDIMRKNEEDFTKAVISKGAGETPHLNTNVDIFAQEKRAADRKAQEERASITPWTILSAGVSVKDNIGLINNILAKKPGGGSAFEMNSNGKLVDKSEASGKHNDNVSAFLSMNPGGPFGQVGFAAYTGVRMLQALRDNLLGIKNKDTEIYTGEQGKAALEVIEFLKNSNQYDEKKPANAQYQNGLKLYEAAIKSGVFNQMAIPEFPKKIANDFEDAYIPQGKYNPQGELVSSSGGRSGLFTVPGLDQNKVNDLFIDSRIIGPDLINGAGLYKFIARDGKPFSAKLNSPTLEAAFGGLSNFNIKSNEAIFKPSLQSSQVAVTDFEKFMTGENGLEKRIQKLNDKPALAQYNENQTDIQAVTADLKAKGYFPIQSYKDPNVEIYSMSFINRKDPDNPDIQVLKYSPGSSRPIEVTNMASFNADIYQQAIGNFSANLDSKASKNKIRSTTVNE